MNLFENLQLMKENSTFESQVDYEVLKQNDIDFFENGAGVYRVVTPDGDTLDIDIELSNSPTDRPKYFVSLPSEDVKSVDVDLTTAIIDVINKLNNFPINKGSKKPTITTESKDDLWTKFSNHYNGFIPVQDMSNYFSLDQFSEFVNWARKEADLDTDMETLYDNWEDAFAALNEINGDPENEVDSISVENVFNFFSTSDLEEFWNWVETEYDLNEDELDESTKLEEASTNKSGYTLNFGAWRTGNGMSFASKNELVSFLRSNYIDLETVITYCENVTNDFKNSMHKIDNSFIKDRDAQKKFFDSGYVKIVDVKNDDLEESVKLEKLSIGNKLQTVFDKFDSNIKLVGFMLQYIDEDTIEKMYNEIAGVEEATSGIGGAYTTKAIDILPTGVKKVNENLYDEYLERVMDEKSNVELVNLLHEIRDNDKLKSDDKKKLEDEIRTKVRSIKTEAITEFYGKDWTDEEIKKAIEVAKENPEAVGYMDPDECATPFNHNGKTYYTVGEGKEIVFDGKDCVVYLTADEELNRYLSYYEMKWIPYSDGDGENGMSAPDYEINEVPYKVIEV